MDEDQSSSSFSADYAVCRWRAQVLARSLMVGSEAMRAIVSFVLVLFV
ncbi:MAG: hypothetical protein JWM53_1377, partial [bacterium]|nr:hypothetical protein [bacterium]